MLACNTESIANTASMQIRLPIELWETIVSFCTQSDRAVVSRVSKRFNLLATQMVYREISLQNPERIIGCYRTLVRNVSAALCVREFCLYSTPEYPLSAFYDIHVAALKAMVNMEALHFRLGHGNFDIPTNCYFPNLHTFVSSIPYSSATSAFLKRHPTIEVLSLPITFIIPHNMSNIHLPRLVSFNGPNQVLNMLAIGSSVRKARIFWDEYDYDGNQVETSLKALAPSSSSMRELDSISEFWCPRMPILIACFCPSLTHLRFIGDQFDYNVLREGVGSGLAGMNGLQKLDFIDHSPHPLTKDICNQDMQMLQFWSSICRSLDGCHLPSGATWQRIDNALWLPTTRDPVILEWWREMVTSGSFDSLAAESFWMQDVAPTATTDDKRQLLIDVQRRLAMFKGTTL